MQSINTPQEFDAVLKKGGVLLVDFWAEWCAPCRGFTPILERFAAEHPEITIVKVNADENRALAAAMGVRGLPTLFGFSNGEQRAMHVGAMNALGLEKFVEKNLK